MTQTQNNDKSPFGYSRSELDKMVRQICEDGIMFASFLTTNECGYFECKIDGDIHMTFEILALTGKNKQWTSKTNP